MRDTEADGVILKLGVVDVDGEPESVCELVMDAVIEVLGVVVADTVGVRDGDGDADMHSPDPTVLEVPGGHCNWVGVVDPGGQMYLSQCYSEACKSLQHVGNLRCFGSHLCVAMTS